jgi:dihydropteroate synthase
MASVGQRGTIPEVTEIFGILNVTRDSFSDGGRWIEPAAAIGRGLELVADGADVIDVGAASTHPDSEDVSAAEELRRLEPVVGELLARGVRVSVDTWRPEVIGAMAALGVEFINDVTALADPRSVAIVREAPVRVVLMHSTAPGARAVREASQPPEPPEPHVERVRAFFERRLAELEAAGVARERTLLDPGMGFFLSSDPAPSLAVLKHLGRLAALGRPLLVSTSRKSFLGAVTGRGVHERGAATLASELFAARAGAAYLRTHDVRALADALAVLAAIERAE